MSCCYVLYGSLRVKLSKGLEEWVEQMRSQSHHYADHIDLNLEPDEIEEADRTLIEELFK